MKVSNIIGRGFRAVPNQFMIKGIPAGSFYHDGEKLPSGDAFQSYESIICFMAFGGQIYLDINDWDYSRTTGKYRNIVLGEDIKETRKKIKSGEYILTDLNTNYMVWGRNV
jgi:hypothetical protein